MERANGSRDRVRGEGGGLLRSTSQTTTTTSSDFGLQWGNRKRLRWMKVQIKDDSNHKITAQVDRRVVRADKEAQNHHHHNGNGYLNLRQQPFSPPLPPPQRILRNSENCHERSRCEVVLVAGQSRARPPSYYYHQQQPQISGGGSGELAAAPVWPPKFVIALTNKEKEEDFFIFKGSKLPQKRPKLLHTTLNLVCPGGWLCDLTLERYEVREKKISKKRPRGLKAMGNMVESDSE